MKIFRLKKRINVLTKLLHNNSNSLNLPNVAELSSVQVQIEKGKSTVACLRFPKHLEIDHFTLYRVHSFGMIRIGINYPRSLGSWCIKRITESLTRVDSVVPLKHLVCEYSLLAASPAASRDDLSDFRSSQRNAPTAVPKKNMMHVQSHSQGRVGRDRAGRDRTKYHSNRDGVPMTCLLSILGPHVHCDWNCEKGKLRRVQREEKKHRVN